MKLLECSLYMLKKVKGLLMSILYLRDIKKLPISKQASVMVINHNKNIKKYFIKLFTILGSF